MPIRRQHAVLAATAVVVAMGCAKQATQTPAPAPAPSPAQTAVAPRPQTPAPQTPAMPDSIAQMNDAAVARVMASIAGKENLPAEQVFKDIQVLKGQPAGRVVTIMNTGYARALGVSCASCHNPNDMASNEKANKKTARGMIRMVNMINEGNKTIPEYEGDVPVVNCVVCHRGARRPVNRLPGPGGAPGRGGQPGQATPPVRTGD